MIKVRPRKEDAMAKGDGHIVVFRYTKEAGGYAGVVTWTSFPSKEDFDRRRDDILHRCKEEVVAEGVTSEEAVDLARQTPLASRVRVALHEATDPNGEVDDELLRMNLFQALLSDRP